MALQHTEAKTVDSRSALHAWAAGYGRAHVDLGTGDGRFAIDLARRNPNLAVVGLDTNLDHLRGARRRHPANVRFVAADALGWPLGMIPAADAVTINFPYGSLLRGLVDGDRGLLTRLDTLLEPGSRLDAMVNASALTATGLDPKTGPDAIVSGLRHIDGLRIAIRALSRDALRRFPSSWAKRLGYGRETDAFLIEAIRQS
jgi:16S rRNA (adenine(1408)-N(1))-methyltransferase